jgi:hypothetical protein
VTDPDEAQQAAAQFARELDPARWKQFSVEEKALICVALATFVAYEYVEHGHDDAVTTRQVLVAARLISEMNVAVDQPGVDHATIAALHRISRRMGGE